MNIKNTVYSTVRAKNGSAMGTTLVLILLGSLLIGSLSVTSRQALQTAKVDGEVNRARLIAEAGAHATFAALAADWSLSGNANNFPPTAYDGGEYDATVAPVPGSDNLYTISSVGKCGTKGIATVAMTVKPVVTVVEIPGESESEEIPTDETVVPGSETVSQGEPVFGKPVTHPALDCALLAGGTVKFAGHADGNATVHANSTDSQAIKVAGGSEVVGTISTPGGITVNGVNALVTGDAYASSYPKRALQISGTKYGPAAVVEVPKSTDFPLEAWKAYAEQNGEVYSPSKPLAGNTTFEPVGGLAWFEGELTISSHEIVNGSIIATEGIKVTSHSTINGVEGFPALMAIDGGVHITAHSVVNGPVLAPGGDVDVTGHGDIIGAYIIAGTDFKCTGQGGINLTYGNWPLAPPILPDQSETSETVAESQVPGSTAVTSTETPGTPSSFTDLYFVAWQK